MGSCSLCALKQLAEELATEANDIIDSSGVGKPSEIEHKPAELRADETADRGNVELATVKGLHQNVHAGAFILTQETTTRKMLETYGIAGTCPTGWPAEGRPVQIAEDPILSTEDTTEKPIFTEDTMIFRSATGSLPYLKRCAMMG